MTTLETWVNFCTDILVDNLKLCAIYSKKGEHELLLGQMRAMKKHVDSYIDFLERQRNDPT